jgi:hypothetical protein
VDAPPDGIEPIDDYSGGKIGYYFPIAPVQVSPEDGLFYKSVEVKMWTTDDDIEIRYTLGGTIPNRTSLLYKKPISIDKSQLLQKKKSYNEKRLSLFIHSFFMSFFVFFVSFVFN